MENKTAVIYARVSPTKHVKTEEAIHASIDESLKICREDSKKEGYTVVKEYIDEYVSGKSSKFMPSFQDMLNDAREHKFDRVYCRRVNRLGRNRADMISAQIELEKLNISLKFVEDGIDTSKPFGKSVMCVLAELAEQDRQEILKNTERGRIAAKEKGVVFGQPKKELDVKLIRKLRLLPANDPDKSTWQKLEKMYNATRSTIIARLKEAGYWDYEHKTVR
jgi:DNA invertase Pin-like site-specific DNA recombinase